MPQKKNPDSLELLRGKCGRVFGDVWFSHRCVFIRALLILFNYAPPFSSLDS